MYGSFPHYLVSAAYQHTIICYTCLASSSASCSMQTRCMLSPCAPDPLCLQSSSMPPKPMPAFPRPGLRANSFREVSMGRTAYLDSRCRGHDEAGAEGTPGGSCWAAGSAVRAPEPQSASPLPRASSPPVSMSLCIRLYSRGTGTGGLRLRHTPEMLQCEAPHGREGVDPQRSASERSASATQAIHRSTSNKNRRLRQTGKFARHTCVT